MRITVCELACESESGPSAWDALVEHSHANRSDLVVLPEMPFWPWPCAGDNVDPSIWSRSVSAHETWLARLDELHAETVITTIPVVEQARRFNRAVVHDRDARALDVAHRKNFLPNEPGFFEATWYEPGPASDEVVDARGTHIAFAICTELWFMDRARRFSKQDVHVLACPRATPAGTTDKWLAGGRTAAVISGAFCVSSNHTGSHDDVAFGGVGWIIEPEEGEILAVTSRDEPFVTAEVDLEAANRAKHSYPRDVRG